MAGSKPAPIGVAVKECQFNKTVIMCICEVKDVNTGMSRAIRLNDVFSPCTDFSGEGASPSAAGLPRSTNHVKEGRKEGSAATITATV